MWYECELDHCLQETKMTQILTTTCHRTAVNNEQISNRIVSYKMHFKDTRIRIKG